MADYHAVLQRTLSGFTDPKPQLRTKLYERARVTIKRQLDGRTPALAADAITSEMDKLEQAITQIEQGFDPSYRGPTIAAAEPAYTPPPHPAVAEPSPEPQPSVAAPAAPVELHVTPEPVASAPQAVAPEPAEQASQQPKPAFDPYHELAIPAAPEAPPPVEQAAFDPAFAQTPVQEESVPQALVNPPQPEIAPQSTFAESLEQPSPQPAPVQQAVDPLDQWAQEFMGSQEEAETQAQPVEQSPAEQAATSPAPSLPPIPDFNLVPVDPMSQVAAEVPPAPAPSAASLDGSIAPPTHRFEPAALVDPSIQETLAIPPAPGFGEPLPPRRRKGGFIKWLFFLLLLGGLATAGYFGWENREMLMERLGLADNGVKPTPVKTITITPSNTDQVQPEEQSNAPQEPKSEDRLTPDGETSVTDTQPTLPPTVTVPETDNATNGANAGSTETDASSGGPLPVAQSAILYEEGASAADSKVNPGRVVWSVVQEEPAAGQPEEPAIRARVEIPSQNLVLIMTVKRNADEALPASHLIELVFAVPDDFPGGAIGEINRFVMKESEQGRGDGLVAVPARIADGIFLIALNNLPQAVQTNTQLLQERSWIDIPLQYRTGRRALVTIEKGVPGENVFKEVFAAWNTQ